MAEITMLAPHDPLPEGSAVVLMRRFAEDVPDREMIELIVALPEGGGRTEIPTGPDGAPLDWEHSLAHAEEVAAHEGIERVFTVDRLAGAPERRIAERGGDRSVGERALVDDGSDQAGPGPDMREHVMREAPRRF